MAIPYLVNNETLRKILHPQDHLIECLTTVVKKIPPNYSWPSTDCLGLYNGPTSCAYLFMSLDKSYPKLLIGSRTPQDWATAYLEGYDPAGEVRPDDCGILNEELSFCAVSASYTQDLKYVYRMMQHIESASFDPSGSNEWAFGRAGTLYLLRLVRAGVPASAELISPVIKRLIELTLPYLLAYKSPPCGPCETTDPL